MATIIISRRDARKAVQEGKSMLARKIGIVNRNKLRPASSCSGWSAKEIPTIMKTIKAPLTIQPRVWRLAINSRILMKRSPAVDQNRNFSPAAHPLPALAKRSHIKNIISKTTPKIIRPARMIFSNFRRRASSGSSEGTLSQSPILFRKAFKIHLIGLERVF
jgi:hypothetical protein